MSDSEKKKLLDGAINSADEIEAPPVLCYDGTNPLLSWLARGWHKFKTGVSIKMLLMLLGLIFVGTANRVAFKIMTNSTQFRVMPDGSFPPTYSTFIAQVTNFIYMPVFWPIVWYFMAFTERITPAMRAFPVWKYAVMGALDSLAGILMVCGGAGTSGPLQQLLIQGAIPFTMVFSFTMTLGPIIRIFGKTLSVRYRWTHLVGAGLIVSGLVLALIPQFIGKGSKSAGGTKPLYAIMFFLAVIPTAFSNVFKEIAFKGSDLDIFLVNAWVATFQFLIGFPLLPIGITVDPNPLEALKALPKEFWEGMQCFVGKGPNGHMCVERLVMVHILVYLVINIFYNILVLAILKYGSASLLQISSAMLLPMANIVFTLKPIMNEFPPLPPSAFPPGVALTQEALPEKVDTAANSEATAAPIPPPKEYNNYAAKLSGYDIGGLFLILFGLGFYRALSESGEEEEKTNADGYTQIPAVAEGSAEYETV